MVKNHLPRASVPNTWPIQKKSQFWVTRPNSGAHTLKNCMSLGSVMTEMLGVAKNLREARKIIQDKQVLINKVLERDSRAQVGLMDILEFPKIKKQYRMVFNTKGKLSLVEVPAAETNTSLRKIKNKKHIKGKKIQLTLDNGTTLLTDKEDYKPGDSIIVSLPDKKIKSSLKLEKGATVYLTAGKKVGTVGKVEEIQKSVGTQISKITIKTKTETFDTKTSYAFVVGKDKSTITTE